MAELRKSMSYLHENHGLVKNMTIYSKFNTKGDSEGWCGGVFKNLSGVDAPKFLELN